MDEAEIVKLYGELRALTAKIDHLTDMFNRAAHGDGFPRCARHSERIQHVEESVELSHARISGIKKWLISGLVGIASFLVNSAWNIIQASIKR